MIGSLKYLSLSYMKSFTIFFLIFILSKKESLFVYNDFKVLASHKIFDFKVFTYGFIAFEII